MPGSFQDRRQNADKCFKIGTGPDDGTRVTSRTTAVGVFAGGAVAAVAAGIWGRPLAGVWSSPGASFWFVTLAALLCLPFTVAVLIAGWRQATAELAVIGAALTSLSTWSLVHGITMPGYLYGPNGGSDLAGRLALPAALAMLAPTMFAGRRTATWVAVRWRMWCVGALAVTVAAAVVVVLRAAAVPSTAPEGPVAVVAAGVMLAGVARLVARHDWLYRIGRRPASLAAMAAISYLGLAGVLGLFAAPATAAWWLAHALDAGAAVAAAVAALLAYAGGRTIASVVAPVVNRDPLAALELGLAPEVHAFVAALERKDAITRDHVVRVGDLATRVAIRAGLPPDRVRAIGIAALLHDVGKLVVPSDILGKTTALTDEEFAVIKTHAEQGAALLSGSLVLRPAAPLVRGHHERPDGTGYPDRLGDSHITMEMGIVSACDAWDAMTNDRQYRRALTDEQAAHVLRDGAGTQWRLDCVDLVLTEVGADPRRHDPFATVGRTSDDLLRTLTVCADAVPVLSRS